MAYRNRIRKVRWMVLGAVLVAAVQALVA